MTLKLFGMLIVALLLGAVGQVSMKISLGHFTDLHGPLTSLVMLIMAMLSPGVAFGLACYVVSSTIFLFLMSRIQLSLLYPMVAMNYVFVTVLCRVVLHEQIPPLRVAGLAVIIAGVVILASSGQPPAEQPAVPEGLVQA